MEDSFILASKSDTALVSAILGEAFTADPLVLWISAHPQYSSYIFELLMPFYFEHGEVWINKDKNTALMCLKPGAKNNFQPSFKQIVYFVKTFGLGAFYRINKLSYLMNKHHYKEDHYYVLALGTTAEGRSEGNGAKMLRYIINRARCFRVPTYGENSNILSNGAIYEHLGGDVLGRVKLNSKGLGFEPIIFR